MTPQGEPIDYKKLIPPLSNELSIAKFHYNVFQRGDMNIEHV